MAYVRIVEGKRRQAISELCADGSARINRIGASGTMCVGPSVFGKFGIMELVENKPAYDEATHYLQVESEGEVGGKWEVNYISVALPA
jgi:hypothetical protein